MKVVFGHGEVDRALDCTRAGEDVRDDGLCVADDGLGTAEAGGEREFLGGEFFLENVQGVVVRAGEAVDGLVAVSDGDEAAGGMVVIVCGSNAVAGRFMTASRK